jgi:DNA topoisomerase-1
MEQIAYGKENIKSQKIAIPIDEACPTCGDQLVKRKGRYGEFISCNTYPKCKYTRNIAKDGKETPTITDIKCEKCGKDMIVKNSRRGEFLACSGYPECDFISNFKPINKNCPECNYIMASRVLRKKDIFECLNSKCKHKIDA